MTVAELIAKLQKADPSNRVMIYPKHGRNNAEDIWDVDIKNYATRPFDNLIDRTDLLDDKIDTLGDVEYCVVIFTE